MIRIVLADDHTVLRTGLKALLERQREFQVVGEASDGRNLLKIVEDQKPDIVVTVGEGIRRSGFDNCYSDSQFG